MHVANEPEGNYKKGYIKLFRSIDDHWLITNPYYFQAFIRMIMKVNHTKNDAFIEGEVITCDRSQAVFSLNSWVDIFNKKLSKRYWTIQKVRNFFKILKSENMILQEGLRKTTRVTICNYESYQGGQQTDNNETTSRQQTDNNETTTTKELKNEDTLKNEKKEEVKNEFLPEREVLRNVYTYFDFKIIDSLTEKNKINWLKTINKLNRLDGYSFAEIQKTIIWGREDEFWNKNFLSISGLRNKKNDTTKFFKINKQMLNNGTERKIEETREVVTGFIDRIANDPNLK